MHQLIYENSLEMVSAADIVLRYLQDENTRKDLYEKHLNLRNVFRFCGSIEADNYEFYCESNRGDDSIHLVPGTEIVAWDICNCNCNLERELAYMLGGKARLAVLQVKTLPTGVAHIYCRKIATGKESSGDTIKISLQTHLIFVRKVPRVDRIMIEDLLELLKDTHS